MEKLAYTVLLLCWAALPVTHGNSSPNGADQSPHAVERWFRQLSPDKTKVTHLHFYLHDIVAGPNPTNVPIVISNSTARSSTYFGLLAIIDDPLTTGPSPDSGAVGRAQGIFASASLEEIAYHMTFKFVFTAGEFNGSTLSVVGHNPFMNQYRELAIVGGSGAFRLARGTAVLNTVTYNNQTGDAVVKYDVWVLHYDLPR